LRPHLNRGTADQKNPQRQDKWLNGDPGQIVLLYFVSARPHCKGDLTVLVEGDPRLLNRYDVILLNPAKHPVSKQASARRFAEWLLSPGGQAAIGAYKVAGEQLFHPSATAPK
jgi:ABC-type tungstate transport system permease subunit